MNLYDVTVKAYYKRTFTVDAEDYDDAIDEAYGLMSEEMKHTKDIPDDMEWEEAEEIETNYKGDEDYDYE